MLLRVARRKTLLETSAQEFCDLEFDQCSDLSASVYEVAGKEEAVRAHAEHYGSCDLNPAPVVNFNAEVEGCEFKATAGRSKFEFTKTKHRDLKFNDKDHLLRHVTIVFNDLPNRKIPVSKEDIGMYVRSKYDEGDPQWRVLIDTSKWSRAWKKLAGIPS